MIKTDKTNAERLLEKYEKLEQEAYEINDKA